jgi:hypothetical protein
MLNASQQRRQTGYSLQLQKSGVVNSKCVDKAGFTLALRQPPFEIRFLGWIDPGGMALKPELLKCFRSIS